MNSFLNNENEDCRKFSNSGEETQIIEYDDNDNDGHNDGQGHNQMESSKMSDLHRNRTVFSENISFRKQFSEMEMSSSEESDNSASEIIHSTPAPSSEHYSISSFSNVQTHTCQSRQSGQDLNQNRNPAFTFDESNSMSPPPSAAGVSLVPISVPVPVSDESRTRLLNEARSLLVKALNVDIEVLFPETSAITNSRNSLGLTTVNNYSHTNLVLTNPQQHQLEPEDIIIYSEFELHRAFHQNVFYLQTANVRPDFEVDKNKKNAYDQQLQDLKTDDFALRVIAPSGEPCNTQIERDQWDNQSQRCICSFYSMEPGVYTAEVRLRMKGHVGGSPMKILVSRTYDSSGVRMFKDIKKVTGSQQSLTRSAWGLAFNPLQNEVNLLCLAFGDVQVKREVHMGVTSTRCTHPIHGTLLPDFLPTLFARHICLARLTHQIYVADRRFCEITSRTLRGDNVYTFGGKENSDSGRPESLCLPTGLAFDSVWYRVIVADRGNSRICFFTPRGKFLGSFGKVGNGNGEFQFPWGVAVSPKGDKIAVADTDNGRIQIFDQDGVFFGLCNDPGVCGFDRFVNLKGIAFDLAGENIYVTDATLNKIFKMSVDLTQKSCIQLYPSDLLLHPQGLALDKVGNIVVCDTGHNCVRVVTQNGVLISTTGLGTNDFEDGPLGVCTLSDGSVVIVSKDEQLCMF